MKIIIYQFKPKDTGAVLMRNNLGHFKIDYLKQLLINYGNHKPRNNLNT